jgi:MFS family permease
MSHRRLLTGCFVLEGLNSFAVTGYFYYFYFFMHARFGFGNRANLMLAAMSGLIYVPAAFWAGRFAQRAGYFTALKLGFALMAASFATGWLLVDSAAGHILVMAVATVGMCFTWPTLEAIVSEGETYANLQRNVGIYNVVWAATGSAAYFLGGAMLEQLSLNSIFFVPLTLMTGQLALTFYLERVVRTAPRATVVPVDEPHPHPSANTALFMRLAWLANPFAYIAINTLVALMPGVSARLGLTTTMAGFCCSLWCFARLGAFVGLWLWSGWHYRFRWLLASYLALISMFVVMLIVPSLAVVILAQLIFGVAIGLIYYSSLFYSMDVGETKGEHGGIHEAAIGLGNFAGPAVGAMALSWLPQYANSGAVAVGGLLLCGFAGLIWLRLKN